jgi:hypothetical protein
MRKQRREQFDQCTCRAACFLKMEFDWLMPHTCNYINYLYKYVIIRAVIPCNSPVRSAVRNISEFNVGFACVLSIGRIGVS